MKTIRLIKFIDGKFMIDGEGALRGGKKFLILLRNYRSFMIFRGFAGSLKMSGTLVARLELKKAVKI